MDRVLSTSQVRPVDQAAYWREVICRTFVQLDVDTCTGPFSGQVSTTSVGQVRFSRIDANPMEVQRRARHIAEAREDELLVALHLAGRAMGEQDGRQVVLGPGDLALFDAARPYTVDFAGGSTFNHLVVQMPRAMLRARVDRLDSVTAVPIRREEAVGGLVSSFVIRLASAVDTLDPAIQQPLVQQAVDLIATALGRSSPMSGVTGESLQALYRRRIKAFIEAYLGDPTLSPAMIAAAHHISPRYLHKLFSDEPRSVLRIVWDRRLDRCRQDLEDPTLVRQTVSEIATRWGFQNAAHFSRAFRARYGHSPTEHRLKPKDVDLGTAPDVAVG